MFGWNAKISLASVVVLTRLTAASGLLGWFVLLLAAHKSQDQPAGLEVAQERESMPPTMAVEQPETWFSFSTASGWVPQAVPTQAVPTAGNRLAEQDGKSPERLPLLPASGSQRAEELGELLALRARVGTGLGDESEFRAALAALFEQEDEHSRAAGIAAPPAESPARLAEEVEPPMNPHSTWQPQWLQPAGPPSGAPVQAPGPQVAGPQAPGPQAPGPQVAGQQVPGQQGQVIQWHGTLGLGAPGHGPVGHGPVGHGPVGHGPLGHGEPGHGSLGHGAPGHGPLGQGGPEQRVPLPGPPVSGFRGPGVPGPGVPGPGVPGPDVGRSEAAAARMRLAARGIEEAAWELEQVGEYGLADDLRRQSQEIYLRARRLRSAARSWPVY